VIAIANHKGKKIARGVVRYKSVDIEKIKGLHSEQIELKLGYEHGRVVVHRDDLVLL
jgi:glutamate 5-kinase